MRRFVLMIVAAVLLHGTVSAAPILRSKSAIPGRYIVLFHDDVAPGHVKQMAHTLARAHGGRVLATFHSSVRGFGLSVPPQAVEALARNPHIRQIEEDAYAITSSPSSPTAERFRMPRREPAKDRGLPSIAPTSQFSCGWHSNQYFMCSFADSTFWHLDRISSPGTQLTNEYGYTWAGGDVRAYVVDSGVYAAHSEFEGRVVTGGNMTWDPDVSDPIDPGTREEQIRRDGYPETNPCGAWQPNDSNGVPSSATHGTAVASVLGGHTVGVAKNVTIVPVKVMNCWGESSKLAVIRGLDWVTADMTGRPGRAVVSLSLGFLENASYLDNDCDRGPDFVPCLPALEYQVNKLIGDYNIPVVSAAHNLNNGNCDISPARMGNPAYPTPYYPITVGGTAYVSGVGDQRWSCVDFPNQCSWTDSNSRGSNYGPCVNVWAPAFNIRVAAGTGPNDFRAPGQYSSGTSYSAPMVAGIIARLLDHYPTMPATDVLSELTSRAYQRWPNMPASFDPDRLSNLLVYIPRVE